MESVPTTLYMRSSSSERTVRSCILASSDMNGVGWLRQPDIWSHLFRATTKGTFLAFSILRLSRVWGWKPRAESTTSMAMSAAEPPRVRRFLKTSWPGVSMTSRPGMRESDRSLSYRRPQASRMVSAGRKLAPMCWVMPPASRP